MVDSFVGKLIDEIFGEKCEGNFIQPTFITDYPKEMSPLCKEHRDNPELTERFELIVCGKEIANAYSELNDPIDQRERFENQMALAAKNLDEANAPEDGRWFVAAPEWYNQLSNSASKLLSVDFNAYDTYDATYIDGLIQSSGLPVISITAPERKLNKKQCDQLLALADDLGVKIINLHPPHRLDRERDWF